MNTQRWIAVGFVALVALCIVGSNLWLAPLLEGREEGLTPTPEPGTAVDEEEAEPASDEVEGTPPAALEPSLTPQPTMGPDVAAILADLEVEELGPGIDPFITRAGDFTTIDPMHRAEGHAAIYQISETQRALRLEPFTVTAGPDLRVILSPHEAPRTSAETLLPQYLDLGPLQSTEGAQNYAIPEGENIDQYRSVVIYSMSLNIVYSTATLADVRGQ